MSQAATMSAPHQAQELITELERGRFFGSLELKFEAGRIVLLRKTETIKPMDYRNPRGVYDHEQHNEGR